MIKKSGNSYVVEKEHNGYICEIHGDKVQIVERTKIPKLTKMIRLNKKTYVYRPDGGQLGDHRSQFLIQSIPIEETKNCFYVCFNPFVLAK